MAHPKKSASISAAAVAFITAVLVVLLQNGGGSSSVPANQAASNPASAGARSSVPASDVPVEAGEARIRELFDAERSDAQVEVTARVSRLLPDDNDGDRHQRFLIEFRGSGHSVLISHNIDLAEPVPVEVGDWVTVVGEYEWSERGGVIHWTHHNPARNPIHPPGWIDHHGVRYE